MTTTTKKDEIVIAVYGTLKKGESNHGLIKSARGTFVAEGITTVANFNITGYGYPIVRKGYDNGSQVKCELYSFKDEATIADIDQLEGHPNWYVREPFKFTTPEGTILNAQMYVQEYQQDVFDRNVERIHSWDNKNIKYWSSKGAELDKTGT